MWWADCLAGEVASINDDVTDNYFCEPAARFPSIDEDKDPYRHLVTNYLCRA